MMDILIAVAISFTVGAMVGYLGLRRFHISDKTWQQILDNLIFAIEGFTENEEQAGATLKAMIKSNIRQSGLLKKFDQILLDKGIVVKTPGR